MTASFTGGNGMTEETIANLQFRRIQDAFPGSYPPGSVPPGNFVVKVGSFTTTIGGAGGGCTYDGGDSWVWDSLGGSLEDSPDAGIETIPGGRDGDLYRKFNGWCGSGAHEVPYTFTCPPNDPGFATFHPRWWDPVVASGGVTTWPAVSSDGGNLQGSVTKDRQTWRGVPGITGWLRTEHPMQHTKHRYDCHKHRQGSAFSYPGHSCSPMRKLS